MIYLRTFIELWDNQEEMSQLLIQSNLAISSKPQTEDSVHIFLLLSQQFRVVLKSVNNLNDIIVALECGLALTCKAHNLELATETHEEALKVFSGSKRINGRNTHCCSRLIWSKH